jgi:hypothetical protein
MKTDRTEKLTRAQDKNSRKEIIAEPFGIERKGIKPFTDEDREKDRRFENSLRGFGYREDKHEASRYLSKTVARLTLSTGVV